MAQLELPPTQNEVKDEKVCCICKKEDVVVEVLGTFFNCKCTNWCCVTCGVKIIRQKDTCPTCRKDNTYDYDDDYDDSEHSFRSDSRRNSFDSSETSDTSDSPIARDIPDVPITRAPSPVQTVSIPPTNRNHLLEMLESKLHPPRQLTRNDLTTPEMQVHMTNFLDTQGLKYIDFSGTGAGPYFVRVNGTTNVAFKPPASIRDNTPKK